MAFKLAVALVTGRRVQALLLGSFPVRFSDRLRRLNEVSRSNAFKAAILARLLDAAPALVPFVLGRLVDCRMPLGELVSDRAALIDHLRENVAGVFHPAGTCRIGMEADRLVVVDTSGRVHGIEGLRVADASIMPSLPAGNTYLPTLMVAEKIAATIRSDR